MEEKELKTEGSVYKFGGLINSKSGIAEFPALIDEKGKLSVPNFVRRALRIDNRKADVQCRIQLRDVEGQCLDEEEVR